MSLIAEDRRRFVGVRACRLGLIGTSRVAPMFGCLDERANPCMPLHFPRNLAPDFL
jgi:hypothetical protein